MGGAFSAAPNQAIDLKRVLREAFANNGLPCGNEQAIQMRVTFANEEEMNWTFNKQGEVIQAAWAAAGIAEDDVNHDTVRVEEVIVSSGETFHDCDVYPWIRFTTSGMRRFPLDHGETFHDFLHDTFCACDVFEEHFPLTLVMSFRLKSRHMVTACFEGVEASVAHQDDGASEESVDTVVICDESWILCDGTGEMRVRKLAAQTSQACDELGPEPQGLDGNDGSVCMKLTLDDEFDDGV